MRGGSRSFSAVWSLSLGRVGSLASRHPFRCVEDVWNTIRSAVWRMCGTLSVPLCGGCLERHPFRCVEDVWNAIRSAVWRMCGTLSVPLCGGCVELYAAELWIFCEDGEVRTGML